MEKQVVVRLLRGYFNCCSNKWKMIYIMKKDTWVIVRLQYFSCCSTIRKYFVKIFTHFESDCQISDGTLELLVVQYICVQIWKVNNFLVEVTSILDLLHGGTKLSSIWKESLYPNSYMRFGESFQKTLFTARTIHMLLWKNWSSWKGSERIESTRISKKSIC